MAQIQVNNLTFYYDNSYENVFEDVSFVIDSDWKLGFIGRNGKGKTTFLNLLMGKYEYRGSIKSSVPFEYFPYQIAAADKSKNTIDIIEQIDESYEFWMVCRELNLLAVDAEVLYRPFDTLSNGEQTKVMLAVLFARENHFLLIDEPTNHLDMEARTQVRDYLKTKKGFILVSHDRWFLDECIDHVLVLNRMDITVAQGNFSQWWENKQRQDAFELAEQEKLKTEVKKLSKAARQAAEWSGQVEKTKLAGRKANPKENRGFVDRGAIGHKAAKMMARSKNLEGRRNQALEEKEGLLKNVEQTENLRLNVLRHHKEVLVRAKELSLYYGDKAVIENLDMEIKNGQCVVLAGKNGAGKSSVLKKILGEEIASKGLLDIAAGLRISYVSQDTSHLHGKLDDYITASQIDPSLFKALLRKLDFEREQFDRRLEEYSSGQKKKVLIARSLCEQAHLYIWDEPLNYIDIFSRMQLTELLRSFRPTMLMVEHDRTFVDNLTDQIIKL